MKTQAYLRCCKNKKTSDIFLYKKKPKGENNFGIKKYKRLFKICKNCNHMFAYFDFDLKNLYNENYSKKAYGNLEKISNNFNKIISLPLKNSDNKNRVKRCLSYLSKNHQILDIGTGLGVFLYELKKRGFKVSGIEPDPNLFQHCKEIIKTNIYNYDLKNFPKKKVSKYDFISLNKVLEHVSSPAYFVKKIKKLLKPRGIVYIEVPDQIAANINKNRQELMVEHLHVFSKISFSNLLKKNNFKVLKIEQIHEPSGKYTIYGFFKNL